MRFIPFLFLFACGSPPEPTDDAGASADASADAARDTDAMSDPDAPSGFWLSVTLTLTPQQSGNYATVGIGYHCPADVDQAAQHATTLSITVTPDDGEVRSLSASYSCDFGFPSASWFDLPCGSSATAHVIATNPDGVDVTADSTTQTVVCQ